MNKTGSVFDIRDFGAISAVDVINTTAIDQAITVCAARGGGHVLVAGGCYTTGTIYLKTT